MFLKIQESLEFLYVITNLVKSAVKSISMIEEENKEKTPLEKTPVSTVSQLLQMKPSIYTTLVNIF